jgi:uncharacterized ferredoxin-like protein
MERLQRAVDTAENITISQYRARHATVSTPRVSVECGMCGAVQSERPRPGARWIAMDCRRCGLRSLAHLMDRPDEEPTPGPDGDWWDGLDSRGVGDGA